jgi:hypothetical protein
MGDEDEIEESLLSSMKLEIDAMRREVDLPDKIVLKLEVAAEQAIASALKARPPVNLGNIGLPGQDPPAVKKEQTLSDEDDETKAKKEEQKKAKNAGPNAPQGLAGALQGLRNQVDVALIKQQEPWTKALQSSLSEEQKAKWNALEESRRKALRHSRIANKVQELDGMLVFTEAQRTKVYELVDRVMGDDLANVPVNRGMAGGAGNVVVMMAVQGGKELSKEDLAPILSPLQLKEYEGMKEAAAVGPFGMPKRPGKKDAGTNGEQTSSSSGLGFSFIESPNGLKVERVESNSQASRAGVLVGDIIDTIGDDAIDTVVQFRRALSKSGRMFVMNVKRDGQNQALEFDGKK